MIYNSWAKVVRPFDFTSGEQAVDFYDWLDARCQDEWCVQGRELLFKNPQDAVLCTLVWSGHDVI